MERFTVSMDEELFEQFDKIASDRGYNNRSEAIRDLVREYLEASRLQKDNKGYCIATLTYIYNHHERDLAALVTSSHHEHHDITLGQRSRVRQCVFTWLGRKSFPKQAITR